MNRRVNDNLTSVNGKIHCAHCDHVLAEAGEPALHRALTRRGDVAKAGPQVRAGVPAFIRAAVEFRQKLCPGCHTALLTEVAAVDDVATRETTLTTPSD
ncbi:hypothetical protein SAMN05216207_10124 [Pseudonocardia ammonioxydans]|uniref:Uncharacterized protein n=1 Tax=Pseudonocardia ammonioxydans TaxID=260086 RepID=A0A1I4XWS7_PSUAM|nr:hypothetical protein SAMN05216207_10124 [Pseudonocardia ammonioxydans]